jgi:hypothetical protein
MIFAVVLVATMANTDLALHGTPWLFVRTSEVVRPLLAGCNHA